MTETYLSRLRTVTEARGPLCVGIDPHPHLLDAWGLTPDADGLERFARGVVEALGESVAVFKPQSALFEPFGSAGIAVLERVLADIRAAGAISIMDAKRGDIGSTMAGYARAYLADGSPLASDAVTISPYLGYESLRPALDLAQQSGRGVHVLCRTSNPEGHTVQLACNDFGVRVAQTIVDAARADNASHGGNEGCGHVGLVVGGTHADLGIDLTGFNGAVLVPGIGAQGGTLAGVAEQFANVAGVVLPSASREVLSAGPTPEGLRARVQRLLAS